MEFIDFALRHWVLFALALIIIGLLIGTEVYQRLLGIKALNPVQVTQLINHNDALLLDIRDSAAYRNGHIPEAKHIPASELKQRAKELIKFKEKPVVVYCSNGMQSNSAGKTLQKEGFNQVSMLRGGLATWQDANLPLNKKK